MKRFAAKFILLTSLKVAALASATCFLIILDEPQTPSSLIK